MFQKPFKIKSQTILRGSDKKKLQARIKEQLKFDEGIFTNKEEVKKVKIFSNRGDSCFVYCLRGNPMLFEIHEKIYPSVYLLWEMNKVVPRIKTHPNVIKVLINGADLMLPGMVVTESEDYFQRSFNLGDVVSITTTSSNWPLAVGNALVTSQSLLEMGERSGKGVSVIHVFGDHLWKMGEKTSPPKQDDDDEEEVCLEMGEMTLNDDEETSEATAEPQQGEEAEEEEKEEEEVVELTREEKELIAANEKALMDNLLHDCFMTAVKTKLKDKDLPVLTSNFYRNSVLACCPEDKHLDVKKTSYKKFGVFLKKMVEMEVIRLKEISKGSEGITAVNRSSHVLRSFTPLSAPADKEEDEVVASTEIQYGILIQNSYTPPEISTLYRVTPQVHPLFQGVRKNTSLPLSQIRTQVTDYVTRNDLKRDQMVLMDPYLHRAVCANNEGHIVQLPWDAVFKRLVAKLPTDHQLKFPGIAPIIGKGAAPTIDISVEKRINNKYMTLVKFLDKFLIDAQVFGDEVKKLAQASVVITDPSNDSKHNTQVVQIQGNQVRNVEKLLVDSYKIHRKHINGLDQAIKKKKSKR